MLSVEDGESRNKSVRILTQKSLRGKLKLKALSIYVLQRPATKIKLTKVQVRLHLEVIKKLEAIYFLIKVNPFDKIYIIYLINIYLYIYIYTYKHIFGYKYINIYTHIYIYIFTYIPKYTYIHTYIYVASDII